MGWKISKFTTSLMGLIGLSTDSASESSVEARTDFIRQAMLDCLTSECGGACFMRPIPSCCGTCAVT